MRWPTTISVYERAVFDAVEAADIVNHCCRIGDILSAYRLRDCAIGCPTSTRTERQLEG